MSESHDDHLREDPVLRFSTLVMRQLDDRLDEDEARELAAILRDSPDRREEYVGICIQAQTLVERLRVRSLGAEILSAAGDDAVSPQSLASMHDALVLPAIHEHDDSVDEPPSVASPMWIGRDSPPASRRRLWWVGGIAATVALVVGGMALLKSPPAQRVEKPGAVEFEPAAIITSSLDAAWAAPFGFLATGDAAPAAIVELRSGLAKLTFPTGVLMVVEGPAQFRVDLPQQVELIRGRVCADVPKGAEGFAVVTPTARVVDLGTSFGVSVSPEQGSHVEVFEGRIELGSSVRGARPSVVGAGAAHRVDISGAVTSVASSPGLFVRPTQLSRWEQESRGLAVERWRVASELLRRDPSLVLYYTFDNRAEVADRILNRALLAAGRWNIPLSEPLPVMAAGRIEGKEAVSLSPTTPALLLPDYPQSATGKLSLSAWVYARSLPRWAAIVKNRGDRMSGQFSFGLEGEAGLLVARVTDQAGADAYARQADGESLPTGRWVHVAFVADGQTLRLYRDGMEVGSAPCVGVAANGSPRSLSIGMRTSDNGVSPSVSNNGERWDGLIDEMALFHRALSTEEVKRLAQVARP